MALYSSIEENFSDGDINAIRGLEELQKTLLELLFEVVPAQRGAILLAGSQSDGRLEDNEEPFATVFGLDRFRGPDETVKVSRTVAKQVLQDRSSLGLAVGFLHVRD